MLTPDEHVVDCRPEPSDELDYGLDWKALEVARLVPEMKGMGYRVVPGTLDADGCGLVDPDGRRKRLVLITPGVSEVRDDPEDEAPGDNYPDLPGRYAILFGRPRPMVRYRGRPIHHER